MLLQFNTVGQVRVVWWRLLHFRSVGRRHWWSIFHINVQGNLAKEIIDLCTRDCFYIRPDRVNRKEAFIQIRNLIISKEPTFGSLPKLWIYLAPGNGPHGHKPASKMVPSCTSCGKKKEHPPGTQIEV